MSGNEPSVSKVSIFLCLLSIALGLFLIAVEYLIGKELPGTSTFSTIMPALLTGVWFGNKSGQLMPAKTRWYSLAVWMAFSIAYVLVVFYSLDISVYELAVEFGWFSLLFVFFLALSLLLSYAVVKSGEKMGIKSYLKRQESNNG